MHDYHDHADEPYPVDFNLSISARLASNASFPTKLYNMLDSIDTMGYASIVSWQAHGRCFLVHKQDDFQALLSTCFKLSKIQSFHRQLNLYGFMRITSGPDRSAYYHQYFLRGKPFLLSRMTRIKIKGTGIRARSNPKDEPDFWSMKPVGENLIDSKKGVQQFGTALPWPLPSMASASPSTASVVSDSSKIHHSNQKQHQRPCCCIKDLNLEPFPGANNDKSLLAWGMPFVYLNSIVAPDPEIVRERDDDDLDDDADLAQILRDILTESDDLFPDNVKSIEAV
jgi:hypothetical protein